MVIFDMSWGKLKMNKKIIGILICMLFLISAVSTPVGSKMFSLNDPPHLPSNPNPANGSTSVDVNTALSWTGGDPDPGDTVVYDVYFGTDSNPPYAIDCHPTTTYNPGRLDYNTQYYWRIDAWDNHGFSTTGPVWTFHTAENNPPHLPSNPNPANGSTSVDVNTALSWTGGDPDGDPVVYDIYFGTDSNPPNVATDHSSTTYDPGKLNSSTQYYWRIDAWDNKGYSTTGPTWTFETAISTNDPPDKPSRPAGTNSGITRRSYSYSSSTIDPDGDQIFYKFDWDDGTNSGWVGPYNSGETLYLSHVWTTSGSYSIKVKAKDEHGAESVWSYPLPISMPMNQQIIGSLFFRLLERLTDHFSLQGRLLISILLKSLNFR